MTQLFNDGIMEATQYPEGWVYIQWLPHERNRLSKQFVKNMLFIEKYIHEQGLKGWFTSSEINHLEFQMLIHKFGGKFQTKDKDYVYFAKWIMKEGDKYVRTKATQRTSITAIS